MSFLKKERKDKSDKEKLKESEKIASAEWEKFVDEHNSVANDYISYVNKVTTYWKLFGICGFLTGAGVLFWHISHPLVEKVPYVVLVDKLTGSTDILQTVPDQKITQTDVTNKYWVAEFIRNYEAYNYATIQTTYDRTISLSDVNVASQYKKIYEGQNARDVVLGQNRERKVFISNIMLDEVNNDGTGVARVRFTTETTQNNGQPTKEYWIATVGFKYDKGAMDAGKRLMNPLGFRVTTYNIGVEVIQ